MKHTVNIRILRKDYPLVQQLISRYGQSIPHSEVALTGYSQDIYKITCHISSCTANTLSIGDSSISTEINRLNPLERAALPGQPILDFNHYNTRFREVINRQNVELQAEIGKLIYDTYNSREKLLPALRLTLLEGETYLYKVTTKATNNAEWCLALVYDMSLTAPPSIKNVDKMGVDIGLKQPLVIANSEDISCVELFNIPETLKTIIAIAKKEDRALWDYIRPIFFYQLMPAINYLSTASNVNIEKLSYGQYMDKNHVARSRLLSFTDIIFSFLPTYLSLQGTQVNQVPPLYSSQVCHKCLKRGIRKGDTLYCDTHGPLDAHKNAAIMIYKGGAIKNWGEYNLSGD